MRGRQELQTAARGLQAVWGWNESTGRKGLAQGRPGPEDAIGGTDDPMPLSEDYYTDRELVDGALDINTTTLGIYALQLVADCARILAAEFALSDDLRVSLYNLIVQKDGRLVKRNGGPE